MRYLKVNPLNSMLCTSCAISSFLATAGDGGDNKTTTTDTLVGKLYIPLVQL